MMLTPSTRWFIFAAVVGIGILIYLLAPVITPFLASALLAYLGDPVVDRLEKLKLSRTTSVSIVFFAILLVLISLPLILLPLVEQQISALVMKMPGYLDKAQTFLAPYIKDVFHTDVDILNTQTLKNAFTSYWKEMGGVASAIVKTITKSGFVLVGWLANLVLIPVVTFYLLRDWDILVAKIGRLIPRAKLPVVVKLAKESDEVLGSFLRGQFVVMLVLGIVYTTGLWIVGLDLALLIGMIAGLVSFVPYLGFIVGILLAGIATIMQFGDPLYLLHIIIVFGVGQALEGMLLTPLLVGDKIGLHPVAVIFSVMAGGQLFGFVGILLALPVAAVVMVMIRHVQDLYTSSGLYNENQQKPTDSADSKPAT